MSVYILYILYILRKEIGFNCIVYSKNWLKREIKTMKCDTSDQSGTFLNDRLAAYESHYNSKLLDHHEMTVVNSRSRIYYTYIYIYRNTCAIVVPIVVWNVQWRGISSYFRKYIMTLIEFVWWLKNYFTFDILDFRTISSNIIMINCKFITFILWFILTLNLPYIMITWLKYNMYIKIFLCKFIMNFNYFKLPTLRLLASIL